jgi:hypothetical protein
MWWLPVAALADDDPALASSEDFRSYLDQAKFFLRKEWYEDAREQLERAVGTEDGKLEAEAWFLLAKVRYELGDLQGARFAADRALVHSQDDAQTQQTHELLSYLDQKFGFVTVDAPYDGVSTLLEVQLESTIFDPDLKVWLNRLQRTLAEPVVLPYELGLPAGSYTINGEPVEVAAGSRQLVTPKVGSGGGLAQSVQLEIGLGATGFAGGSFQQLIPAPTAEVSLGVPLGPLAVGVLGAWVPQPFTTLAGTLEADPLGWNAGVRIGFELPRTQPVVVRPSVTWRIGQTPGLEVGCAEAGAGWSCSRDAEVRQLYVYSVGLQHQVGAELLIEYLDRSRSSGFGGGVKMATDGLLGAYPRAGTAVAPSGEITYEVEAPRAYVGLTWRLLAVLSYGF